MDEAERRWIALGRIIEEAGMMEAVLRKAFCALLGSKYAALVAAREGADRLIKASRAIVKVHREISDDDRAELDKALHACIGANEKRNMIHGSWGLGANGEAVLFRTVNQSHQLTARPMTVEDLDAVQLEIVQSTSRLSLAVSRAFGANAGIEAQLRFEDYLRDLSRADVEEIARAQASADGISGDDLESVVRRTVDWIHGT